MTSNTVEKGCAQWPCTAKKLPTSYIQQARFNVEPALKCPQRRMPDTRGDRRLARLFPAIQGDERYDAQCRVHAFGQLRRTLKSLRGRLRPGAINSSRLSCATAHLQIKPAGLLTRRVNREYR
jgi:hypothetical protein